MPSVRPDGPLTAEAMQGLLGVSRETTERLADYLDLLRRWQRAINLVGASTLADPWRRHILDCGQLARYLPSESSRIIDLGSGAGLPGIVLGLMTDHRFHLVESDQRKAVFLRETARTLGMGNVQVHPCRIEALKLDPADILTARALAGVQTLLDLSASLWHERTVGLFLKGERLDEELTAARRSWTITSTVHDSLADPKGHVLQVREVCRAG